MAKGPEASCVINEDEILMIRDREIKHKVGVLPSLRGNTLIDILQSWPSGGIWGIPLFMSFLIGKHSRLFIPACQNKHWTGELASKLKWIVFDVVINVLHSVVRVQITIFIGLSQIDWWRTRGDEAVMTNWTRVDPIWYSQSQRELHRHNSTLFLSFPFPPLSCLLSVSSCEPGLWLRNSLQRVSVRTS